MRDVFTMGARPIALLNSLRFGNPDDARTRFLLNGVVEGIASYGNCTGVPTVGGEIYFDPCYNGNILVNAFCLGLVKTNKVFTARTGGMGNAVIYVGSKTGRDGIHGASLLASSEFDDSTEEKRPTVQVGDPFTEKLLIEACLELMKKDWVVGVQDMGAAGLTSTSFEMAGHEGTGIEMDLSRVPLREEGMSAYEILLSESQERMLFVVEKGREEETLAILNNWDLDSAVIGQVTDTSHVRILYQGAEVVNLPVSPVVEGCQGFLRPTARPEYLDRVSALNLEEYPVPDRGNEALKKLLAHPNIASKEWVYEQYDHMVRLNTLVLPGSDAAVLRVKDSEKALALSVDCNSRYCYLDPFEGAKIAVAECARNIVCSGGVPIGLTNCLNFGNPERPEIMWQFEQAVRGISAACEFFDIPVVSGNVSLYNETKGEAIYPTPTVAVVGLLEDRVHQTTQWFKNTGDCIGLLGITLAELGGSEYLNTVFDKRLGKPPHLDLERERNIQQLCLKLIRAGLIHSAHDCSEGGLAVAAVESCMSRPEGPLGASLNLTSAIRKDILLFGESQARIIISYPKESQGAIEAMARKTNSDFTVIGEAGGSSFSVTVNDEEFIQEDIQELNQLWRGSLGNYARQVT
jgi:phosphoribosylformylglycinamidine synthase